MWFDKRYHSLNYELKQHFQKKIIKLSIDGGFSCPNRDGTKGVGGCSFCSELGSGDFTSNRNTIQLQMKAQQQLLADKWPHAQYIAYFQSFTNTYGDVEELKNKYTEALQFPNTVGLAIATRPDCINSEVVQLLQELSKSTYLWVELGIQTIHEELGEKFNRCFNNQDIEQAVKLLHHAGIRTVAHVMINLPGDSQKGLDETIDYIVKQKFWGIKLHMLHLLQGTALGKEYMVQPFELMDREAYIHTICDIIEKIPPEMVIHRITGDGDKTILIAPTWTKNKRTVLNGVDRELTRRNSFQGQKFKE